MTATKMNFYARSKQRFTSWKKYKKAAKKALLTDNRTMYEAYIGKRNVTVNDLQFLYSDRTSKQFLWNVIKESEGNVPSHYAEITTFNLLTYSCFLDRHFHCFSLPCNPSLCRFLSKQSL